MKNVITVQECPYCVIPLLKINEYKSATVIISLLQCPDCKREFPTTFFKKGTPNEPR